MKQKQQAPDLLFGAGMEPGAGGRHTRSNPGSALRIETAKRRVGVW